MTYFFHNTLTSQKGIQEIVQKIAKTNPYRIVPCPINTTKTPPFRWVN